jgi:hypothetical protein
MRELNTFFSGAIFFGYLIIAAFFFRFWRQTRERLFCWFAVAFVLLLVERILLLSRPDTFVHQPQFYVTRLVAFLMIAWAIWEKNRPRVD